MLRNLWIVILLLVHVSADPGTLKQRPVGIGEIIAQSLLLITALEARSHRRTFCQAPRLAMCLYGKEQTCSGETKVLQCCSPPSTC